MRAAARAGSRDNYLGWAMQAAQMAWDNRRTVGRVASRAASVIQRAFRGRKKKNGGGPASAGSPVKTVRGGGPVGPQPRLTGPMALGVARPVRYRTVSHDSIIVTLHVMSGTMATDGAGSIGAAYYVKLNSHMHAAIEKFAAMYRMARLLGCEVEYVPLVADTAKGQLIGWWDYSTNDMATSTETFLSATDNSQAHMFSPWARFKSAWKKQDAQDSEWIRLTDENGVWSATAIPFHSGGAGCGHAFAYRGVGLDTSTNLGLVGHSVTIEFKGINLQ